MFVLYSTEKRERERSILHFTDAMIYIHEYIHTVLLYTPYPSKSALHLTSMPQPPRFGAILRSVTAPYSTHLLSYRPVLQYRPVLRHCDDGTFQESSFLLPFPSSLLRPSIQCHVNKDGLVTTTEPTYPYSFHTLYSSIGFGSAVCFSFDVLLKIGELKRKTYSSVSPFYLRGDVKNHLFCKSVIQEGTRI